ncbi:MAG: Gfo/Idh/MocA family oxidoreductase [Armatimonadetes bacterium]|nr:Gfo/Idh/MocA family oxidoreductase [Armatimonadota bacterium]
MPEKLRIGIGGAGGIVKSRHLPGFAKLDDVEVAAVSNRSRESAEAVAAEWRIPNVVDDWRELVRRPDIDIVVVGTWPYMHRDITAAALAAHKHVFCQARMTMNHADARHMYELSRLTDRVTAICPPPTVMPVDPLVRRMLAEGYLGELRHVRLCSLSAGGADPCAPATWRQIAAYSGLNTMALGIWVEVLHQWCGYCREVSASLRTWVAERPGPAGGTYRVSIPDSVTILCEFENGAQGVIEISAVTHHAPPERVELYGSEGTIVHEVGTDGVLAGRKGDPGLQFVPVPAESRGEWNVEANFIAAIRSGTPVLTSFHDGLKYMEFLEAVYRSHQTGAAVRLPLGV